MKQRVGQYITDRENREYCVECNEICSRHCAIYRKAEMRYDADHKKRRKVKMLEFKRNPESLLISIYRDGNYFDTLMFYDIENGYVYGTSGIVYDVGSIK